MHIATNQFNPEIARNKQDQKEQNEAMIKKGRNWLHAYFALTQGVMFHK